MSSSKPKLSLEEQKQKLFERQKKLEEQIQKLEEKEKNKSYTNLKHAKFVMGGDLFSAGFYLDPKDKIGHEGLIAYVNKYGKAMTKFIEDYKDKAENPVSESEELPEQRSIEDYTDPHFNSLKEENGVF